MTREKAIENLKELLESNYVDSFEDAENEALKIAIKALKQEPILEEIRAEIEGLTYYWCEVNPRSVIDDVLNIIDKYKAESEDKE